jgi:hypothetical protein
LAWIGIDTLFDLAIHTSPVAGKRKAADLVDLDDSENVDPLFFAKRAKAAKSSSSKDDLFKPTHYVLTASKTPVKPIVAASSPVTPSLLSATTSPRRTLQPKSQAAKLNTSILKSSALSAPAGRSPTRGKRSGILSNRRRSGPYSRVDPPAFSLGGGSAAPFSLDAALKGTIPSYTPREVAKPAVPETLEEPDMKASWFFDIHEDTPEQEMTNMLQHGTCVLDISSDEESEQKARREGREDKENVPPMDDVSQTSGRRLARLGAATDDGMALDKERTALGEMNTADFYAEGCDESSVIIVPADEEEHVEQPAAQPTEQKPIVDSFEFAPELKDVAPAPTPVMDAAPSAEQIQLDIDVLMAKDEQGSSKAAVLQPMEGTGETFELWESGSVKDENETTEAVATSATVVECS